MEITVFGYKLNVEMLILIGVIYLILVGHTLCGCCNMHGIVEGLVNRSVGGVGSSVGGVGGVGGVTSGTESTSSKVAKKRVLQTNLPTQTTSTEGFTGANLNYGESSAFDLEENMPVNTDSWSAQNLTIVPGEPLSKGVQEIKNRPKQPIPLPEGEMLLFANTEFKPECCPNTFSSSSGCACMTTGQYKYLTGRGGNNVPFSEY